MATAKESPTAPEVGFLVQEVAGRRYAFRDYQFDWLHPWGMHRPVIGIELDVLRAISKSLEHPEVSLAETLPQRRLNVDSEQSEASIFPDGSLFGPVDGEPFGVEYLAL
ncbi:MAG: hypothetical protein GXD23_01140 [Comamonadaceae bacterium]|jgi:hypothetical protein|nr:hypothetical protein [Comamonadaceae bacterium]